MPKSTRKQIIQQTRNKVVRQYSIRLEFQELRIQNLTNIIHELAEKTRILQEENIKLRDQIEALEDWNRRLIEFKDIPEYLRATYIENLKVKYQNDKNFQGILNMINTMSNSFIRISKKSK